MTWRKKADQIREGCRHRDNNAEGLEGKRIMENHIRIYIHLGVDPYANG